MNDIVRRLTEIRATRPIAIREAWNRRARRALLSDGRLFLVAADHPARGVLKAGANPQAMSDRGALLRRLVAALERPGVDGVLGTPDVLDDLVLLGALEGKLAFGSMNRGGLAGSSFELDDRFTAYDAAAIERDGLDGGKMMLRIADRDRGSLETMAACARAVDALAERGLTALVEVFASRVDRDGNVANDTNPAALARAIAIASGLGGTSAYTWLKVPVAEDMARVAAATTLPQVRGLVAGRALLYPEDGDVARAVDRAASVVRKVVVA